jgi:hypothetical protein
MATSQNITSPSRFHNFSDATLADELGRVDAIAKAAEAELSALKAEFKTRGLKAATGNSQRRSRFPVVSTPRLSEISSGPLRRALRLRSFRRSSA